MYRTGILVTMAHKDHCEACGSSMSYFGDGKCTNVLCKTFKCYVRCRWCKISLRERPPGSMVDQFEGKENECEHQEETTVERGELMSVQAKLAVTEQTLSAARVYIKELEGGVGNLTHRLVQLETYLSRIVPASKILPFADVVKANKHPMDMTEEELEAYTKDLTRAHTEDLREHATAPTLSRSLANGNIQHPLINPACTQCWLNRMDGEAACVKCMST